MHTINVRSFTSAAMSTSRNSNHNYQEWETRRPSFQTTSRNGPLLSPVPTISQTNNEHYSNTNDSDHGPENTYSWRPNKITLLNHHDFIKKG
jgi:hypothetical protein